MCNHSCHNYIFLHLHSCWSFHMHIFHCWLPLLPSNSSSSLDVIPTNHNHPPTTSYHNNRIVYTVHNSWNASWWQQSVPWTNHNIYFACKNQEIHILLNMHMYISCYVQSLLHQHHSLTSYHSILSLLYWVLGDRCTYSHWYLKECFFSRLNTLLGVTDETYQIAISDL